MEDMITSSNHNLINISMDEAKHNVHMEGISKRLNGIALKGRKPKSTTPRDSYRDLAVHINTAKDTLLSKVRKSKGNRQRNGRLM